MGFVYVIRGNYRDPTGIALSDSVNIAFKTAEEAQAYCKYHSDNFCFYSFHKVHLGDFTVTMGEMAKGKTKG